MSKIPNGSAGSCYILTNASIIDSEGNPLLKIGATTDDPNFRAKQLTAATACATPFAVAYYRRVSDCTAVEGALHKEFATRRVNDSREFFAVPLWEAIVALDRHAGYRHHDGPPTPFAELFAEFPDDGTARELTPAEQAKREALKYSLMRNLR